MCFYYFSFSENLFYPFNIKNNKNLFILIINIYIHNLLLFQSFLFIKKNTSSIFIYVFYNTFYL